MKSARIVATYLVQRSGSSRTTKTSYDTDYKAILDIFVADLLSVLYQPEWPAAPLYLTVLSKLMVSCMLQFLFELRKCSLPQMSSLEDNKTGGDSSAAKGVALDYLGDIAARLRAFRLEMDGDQSVPSLDEVSYMNENVTDAQLISDANVDGTSILTKNHESVHTFLSSAAKEDATYVVSVFVMDKVDDSVRWT